MARLKRFFGGLRMTEFERFFGGLWMDEQGRVCVECPLCDSVRLSIRAHLVEEHDTPVSRRIVAELDKFESEETG